MQTLLACGPGGRAVAAALVATLPRAASPTDAEAIADAGPDRPRRPRLTIVGSTSEDITLCGLRHCGELDALTHVVTTGAGRDRMRVEASSVVYDELLGWGAVPPWFVADDRAFARAVARSRWLAADLSPSEICARFTADATDVLLLPMSDAPVEAHVVLDEAGEQRAVHVLEWVSTRPHRSGATPQVTPVARVSAAGLSAAAPAPGVLDAIRGAEIVVLPLTAPVTGLGVMLGLPGVRDALRGTSAPVVGISPTLLPARGDEPATLAGLDLEYTSRDVLTLFTDVLDVCVVPEPDEDGTRRVARDVDCIAVAPSSGPDEVVRAALDAARRPSGGESR